MNKHRICTTISAKHWGLLKKYTEIYETQQKTLEAALEKLENGPKQSPLSPEDQLWVRMTEVRKILSIMHRDLFVEFIKTADTERIIDFKINHRMGKHMLEWQCQKPLKKCSLREVMDGLINMGKILNWFDSISYTDNGDYYILKILHNMGINNSKISKALLENLFGEYGVKTEYEVTETSLFIKVFKNTE